MEARAKLRYARLSPRKTRLVVDMVRGKGVQEALNILRFSPQKAAGVVGTKLVSSAVANAEQKGVSDVDRLFVKSIQVDQGPVLRVSCPVLRDGQRKFANRPAT
jgi:large subunit ribosomal protein L22